MQEVERHQNPLGRTPDFIPQIPEPETQTQESLENTVNDPRNADVFNTIATRIENVLKQAGNMSPEVAVVAKVMEILRDGEVRVQPYILVLDMPPLGDDIRTPEEGERVAGYTRTAPDDIITNNFSYNNKD